MKLSSFQRVARKYEPPTRLAIYGESKEVANWREVWKTLRMHDVNDINISGTWGKRIVFAAANTIYGSLDWEQD